MSSIARAIYASYGSVELAFPYHPGLIMALKAEISRLDRRYDPSTKRWSVAPESARLVVKLLRKYFPDAAVIDEDEFDVDPEPIRPNDRVFAVLHLLPSAPPILIQAAYRTLAKTYHPDPGGSHEAMRELNAAYDWIGVA